MHSAQHRSRWHLLHSAGGWATEWARFTLYTVMFASNAHARHESRVARSFMLSTRALESPENINMRAHITPLARLPHVDIFMWPA